MVDVHLSLILGPFLGKNFGTSISPWIVTLEALNSFRKPATPQDPTPAVYLQDPHAENACFHIDLEVHLKRKLRKQCRKFCIIGIPWHTNMVWSNSVGIKYAVKSQCHKFQILVLVSSTNDCASYGQCKSGLRSMHDLSI